MLEYVMAFLLFLLFPPAYTCTRAYEWSCI
jgi:hypothetical protein